MKHTLNELEKGFLCPKCHKQGGLANEVSLGRKIAICLIVDPIRYAAISCGNCGYTELYLLNILEKNLEPSSAVFKQQPIGVHLSNANLSATNRSTQHADTDASSSESLL